MAPSYPANAEVAADAAATGHEAWAIFSRMIAGMMIYGALGWLLGTWLGRPTTGLAIGVLLGLVLGLYMSVLRIQHLGSKPSPALVVSGSQSWSARMTRARIERASEVVNGE